MRRHLQFDRLQFTRRPGRFPDFRIHGDVDMGSEAFAVFGLAVYAEDDAQQGPAGYHAPFLRSQGGTRTGNDVHDDHEGRHEDSHGTDEFIVAYLIRTDHVRRLLAQDQERNENHAVSHAAAEVAGIDDPDQHLAAEEQGDDGQDADEQERIDRCLIFVVQFSKSMRNHVRFSHGIHGTAATDEEGVPAGDDAADTADDEDFGHHGAAKGNGHGIGRDQAADAFHSQGYFTLVEDIADTEDDEGVEQDGQDDGQNQDAADFLQGYGNFFGCLRDDVEADEIERRHDGDSQGTLGHFRRRSAHEELAVQVGRRTGQDRSSHEDNADAAGDPIPCRYDPGPANHCPEGDDQDVPGIEYFVKTRLFRCHMALPLYNTDDFTK